MALAEISKKAGLAAVQEFDETGRSAFLKKYGFRTARDYLLVLDRKYYDSKAIMGVAHGYQFPALGPPSGRQAIAT